LYQDNKSRWQQHCGPSHLGWALLILAILIAATLRFWQLGQIPPGLYRDEALNGLDALNVLAGKHSVFFAANNGREPIYIYLTAISIAIFGRSAMAVRLAAAVVGTFTTWITYQLAKSWFGCQRGYGPSPCGPFT
jgi:4-amino-4-deoxy-L-arabinose transferase-like glycosyltransferase